MIRPANNSNLKWQTLSTIGLLFGTALLGGDRLAAAGDAPKTSYMPVVETETFAATEKRMNADKAKIMQRQLELLKERYDLADKTADAKMSRGKAVQAGVRVKLPKGKSWDDLAKMSPEEIRKAGDWPKGFLPLPHANHPEGGMVFPKEQIDEILKQEHRDLTRFDLDFDIPTQFLPEFPPPIYLTTHPEMGDVSQGKLVTIANFFDLFNGILNPKQIEGLRLLVTPFPQQQFNATDDRRSAEPSRGGDVL
jgi:cytochrome c peroxidase